MKKINRMASRAGLDIYGLGTDRAKWDMSLEAYTELIVQECLNICEEMGDNGKDGHYCADKIAKTFRS